jgi:hypothetical protein
MFLNDYGKVVEEEWLKIKEIRKYIDLDYYVVMPNHSWRQTGHEVVRDSLGIFFNSFSINISSLRE